MSAPSLPSSSAFPTSQGESQAELHDAPPEHRERNQPTFCLTWAFWLESQATLPLEQNFSSTCKLNSLGLFEIKTSLWTKKQQQKMVFIIQWRLTARCEIWGSTTRVREVRGQPYWLASRLKKIERPALLTPLGNAILALPGDRFI